MPRLIAVVSGWILLLAAVLGRIDGQQLMPDAAVEAAADAGGDCPRLCSCLGDVIDCSEKALDALFHIPRWVGNLVTYRRIGLATTQYMRRCRTSTNYKF